MAAPMDMQILQSEKSFPLQTKQAAVEVNENRTELVCTQYQDRTFIVVTQYNKIGTLVSITSNDIVDSAGGKQSMSNTDVLMGKDEPLTHVLARNLITELGLHKPILLSIALKDTSPKTVKILAKILPSLI